MKIVYRTIIILAFFNGNISAQDFGTSGACLDDNNVWCSNYDFSINDIKRSVFVFNSCKQCTGTLVNQNVNDEGEIEQIFITAKHCIKDCNLSVPFTFYFNYQSPDCENESVPPTNFYSPIYFGNRNGRRYRHESTVTLIDEVDASDFAILKINEPIPAHFNVYYAGWTISLFQGAELPHRDIHHPMGDIKKISSTVFTQPALINIDYPCHIITTVIDGLLSLFGVQSNTQIVCTYIENPFYTIPLWTDGVTEHGSSGSALFNNNTRIIANLSNGLSSCNFPLIDQFGRFNTSWLRSSATRSALNPRGDYIITGIPGRQVDCYYNLDLGGYPDLSDLNFEDYNADDQADFSKINFYPARDYQPENHIELNAVNNLHIAVNGKKLILKEGADFTFRAGNEIVFGSGFATEYGANFITEFVPCVISGKTDEVGFNSNYENNNYQISNQQSQISTSQFVLKIIPNPNNGVFTLLCNSIEAKSIAVQNLLGNTVYHSQNNTANNIEIDLRNLAVGVYVVKVITESGNIYTEKVVYK